MAIRAIAYELSLVSSTCQRGDALSKRVSTQEVLGRGRSRFLVGQPQARFLGGLQQQPGFCLRSELTAFVGPRVVADLS